MTLHAACGVVKIIENANNTPKEGSDTKESQTKSRVVLREISPKVVERRANMPVVKREGPSWRL